MVADKTETEKVQEKATETETDDGRPDLTAGWGPDVKVEVIEDESELAELEEQEKDWHNPWDIEAEMKAKKDAEKYHKPKIDQKALEDKAWNDMVGPMNEKIMKWNENVGDIIGI